MGIRTHEPEVFDPCTSASGFANIAATTIGTGAVLLPTGVTGTRARVTGTAGTNMFWTYSGELDFVGKKGLEMWVYLDVPGPSVNSSGFSGYVRLRDSGAANQYQANYVLKKGWNHIRFGRGNFSAVVGSPVWDTTEFVDIQWKLDAITGVAPVMYFSDLSYSGYARPQICVMFDDGYQSVYDNALPIMAARGIPGTVAVIEGRVEFSSLYMPLSTLREMHDDYGWAMVNHSKTHQQAVLNAASRADCFHEIASCRDYLKRNGFTRDDEHLCYCPPYGEWSQNYLLAARDAGCTMFRGIGVADNTAPSSGSTGDLGTAPAGAPGSEIHYLSHSIQIVSTWSPAQVMAYVDHTVYAGRSAILQYHAIESPADASIKTTPGDFSVVMDHLCRLRGIADFITLPQLGSRMSISSWTPLQS